MHDSTRALSTPEKIPHSIAMITAAFEHIGLNVSDKDAAVGWYVENLGLSVVRDVPGKMAFLADAGGIVILEIYSNENAGRLDFAATDPLAVHLAFEVDDPEEAARRLQEVGATVHDPPKRAGDDSMVMLRDPFGLALQLVHRGRRMRRE